MASRHSTILTALIDGIHAHGEMRRETIERAAAIGLYFVAAAVPSLADHVEPEQLELVVAAHPGCRTLTFGGTAWTHARLDAIADGLPGYPGVGEACAAAYVVGEQIEGGGLTVDLTPIQDILREWKLTRGAAHGSEA